MQIDTPQEVGLRVHRSNSHQRRLLPVDVSNNGSSVMITVGKSNAPPPYRIENRHAWSTCLGMLRHCSQSVAKL